MKARTLGDAALWYAELGYRVFPCVPGEKRPLTPRGCLDATADLEQVEAWWSQWPDANVGLATDGLLVVDIDGADNPWPGVERQLDLARGPVARTPRGGTHHYHRQPEGAGWRNTASKLAPLVDTRANGGYVLAPPSVVGGVAYAWAETLELEAGPESLPEPCQWLREALEAGGGVNGAAREREATPGQGNAILEGGRNAALARLGGVMRRAGFGVAEIQAALEVANRERCKPPLPAGEVRRVAASVARYEPDQVTVAVVEGHYEADRLAVGQQGGSGEDGGVELGEGEGKPATRAEDPGHMPLELLRVPGFVSELMDYTLSTAPYPNQALAFAGALAMQALLAGRKVRDSANNRTNIYLLALAHSASGKDHPRKVNFELLAKCQASGMFGAAFASGEGIQDAMAAQPAMLFQTDEIDSLLQSIAKAKDARHEAIMSTLLTLYSSANSYFPVRRKAGDEGAKFINQPNLVLLGTAIPNHYYDALSERMLTSGFFARMLVLESGPRGAGQEPEWEPVPYTVLQSVQDWLKLKGGADSAGNLVAINPEPDCIEQTREAKELIVGARLEAEREYSLAEAKGDTIGTTVWGRVSESVRKLALIYAVSENMDSPCIGGNAVEWACRFVFHGTRRMLYMAETRSASTPFHAECIKALDALRKAPGGRMAHSALLKRMKTDQKSFAELINTLAQRGDIAVYSVGTIKNPGRLYQALT